MNRLPDRIPKRLGTTLMVIGWVGIPIFYVSGCVAIRRGEACADPGANAELAAQCVADAAFWQDVGIIGFLTFLGIAVAGGIIDRVRSALVGVSRDRERLVRRYLEAEQSEDGPGDPPK